MQVIGLEVNDIFLYLDNLNSNITLLVIKWINYLIQIDKKFQFGNILYPYSFTSNIQL